MDREQAGDEEEDRTSSYFNHTVGVTHKVEKKYNIQKIFNLVRVRDLKTN